MNSIVRLKSVDWYLSQADRGSSEHSKVTVNEGIWVAFTASYITRIVAKKEHEHVNIDNSGEMYDSLPCSKTK
jgi:hypothetical protein